MERDPVQASTSVGQIEDGIQASEGAKESDSELDQLIVDSGVLGWSG